MAEEEEKKNLGGQPTSYTDKYPEQARKLCLLGATDKTLADFFGVCEATINNWKNEHPEFLESLRAGKEVADANVADALYKRACGYSHPEVKVVTFEGKITDEKEYEKHYPPDTTAALTWLKNRQGDKWRDQQHIDHSGSIDGDRQVIILPSNDREFEEVEEDSEPDAD